ncbi:MAG: AI-2E family transporter [Solirubrobacterales bacterium]|nr:AI-2E family transporter [Solirubrobacterales bacterium]MBV9471410.1 AI-2E family transporter [Solirubrobacterales bacterium]
MRFRLRTPGRKPVTAAGEAPAQRDSVVGPAAGPPLAPVVVPRWVQLVLLPIALLALWALARAAGPVLLILIVASMVALILNPLVKLLERRRLPRWLAIASIYLGGLALLSGIGVLLSNPISTQISHFERDVPHLVSHANRDLASLQSWLQRHGINVHIQRQGETALQTLQKDVLKRSGDIVTFSRDLLAKIVTISFALVLVLVLSVYLLVYGNEIGALVRRIMPPGDGTPGDDYPLLVQRAVSGYVRGQLLFSLIMGASAAIALAIFGWVGIFPDGERYALFFGSFYGLMEFIPYIGPIIGPLPAVLLALVQDPLTAVWVILLFVALQQLEGHFVAPQVFRISLRINPILIILALLIGYQLYGIVGALVALPVLAVVRQTVLYLRRHLVLEPWTMITAPGVGLLSLGPEQCPDCGAAAGTRDSFCRTCGASLEPRVRTPG